MHVWTSAGAILQPMRVPTGLADGLALVSRAPLTEHRKTRPKNWVPRSSRRQPEDSACGKLSNESDLRASDASGDVLLADLDQSRHHLADRSRGVDLMRTRRPQQRFDLREVAQDEFTFLGRLAVRIRRPAVDATQENLRRSTQEHNRVEPRIEATLV